jgi:hypothetical protein
LFLTENSEKYDEKLEKTTKISILEFFCFLKRILKNMTRNWKKSPNYQTTKLEIIGNFCSLLQIQKEWKKIWKFSPKSQNYTIIKN